MIQPCLNDSHKDSDIAIAECFADYFSSVNDTAHKNCNLSDATSFASCYKHAFYDTDDSDMSCIVPLTVEQIGNCMKQLKFGNAAGPDGLTAEHLKYAHPALLIHLKFLMHVMLSYGYVFEAFRLGLIVPLVKINRMTTTRLRTIET